MYIGPWQEFKLARILQIKDKVDKETDDNNRIDRDPAYSQMHGGGQSNSISEFGANSTKAYSH